MKTCTIEACGKRHVARGLCSGHYQAAVKEGTLHRHQTTAPAPSDVCLWCRTPLEVTGPYKRYCDDVCCKRAAAHKDICSAWPECVHERPRYGKARKPPLERLLNRIDQSGGPDACWPWTGWTNDRGYGHITIDDGNVKRGMGAHKAMYIIAKGPVPDGLFVLHSCDNPPCCNPEHLRVGTQVENMADRREHGAGYARGHDAPRAVPVSDELAETIRALYQPRVKGRGQHALAGQFGLSRTTVQRIVTESDRWAQSA